MMIKRAIKETITDALLIGMAADLLYLYFAGAWYDPYLPILIIELVMLVAIIGFGIYRVIMFAKNATK